MANEPMLDAPAIEALFSKRAEALIRAEIGKADETWKKVRTAAIKAMSGRADVKGGGPLVEVPWESQIEYCAGRYYDLRREDSDAGKQQRDQAWRELIAAVKSRLISQFVAEAASTRKLIEQMQASAAEAEAQMSIPGSEEEG
jgi:hypothetical protein